MLSILLTKRIYVSYDFYSMECALTQLVEALRHKPESHGFVSLWGHWDSLWT
jgi:hypothetical protein